MYRLRHALFAASLVGLFVFVGCDEDQPNKVATPDEVTADPDFGKKSADMMKEANAKTMDPTKLKSMPGGVPKKPAAK